MDAIEEDSAVSCSSAKRQFSTEERDGSCSHKAYALLRTVTTDGFTVNEGVGRVQENNMFFEFFLSLRI